MPLQFPNTPKPAHETEEGKKREAEYHAALGRFVDAFAKVEVAMALALWHYAKTNKEIARAVFSGVRVKEATDFIGRIAESTKVGAEAQANLKHLFDQMRDLTKARNDILHYGAIAVAEGRATVTNAMKALTEDRITSFPASPTILEAMTADLKKIIFHLYAEHVGRPPPRGALSLAILQAPWRYTHPKPQKSRHTKAAKSPPPHKRGPKPSHQP